VPEAELVGATANARLTLPPPVLVTVSCWLWESVDPDANAANETVEGATVTFVSIGFNG
jgi:hypothetical protein